MMVNLLRVRGLSPGRDVDVPQQADEAVVEGYAEWSQEVVPAGLHVLTGSALGVTFTTHVLVVGGHGVRDEVVVSTGRLEEQGKSVTLIRENNLPNVDTETRRTRNRNLNML